MSDPDQTIPRVSLQPPSVDFIDHRLPHHHDAFSRLPVHYDSNLGNYVANSQALVSRPIHASSQASLTASDSLSQNLPLDESSNHVQFTPRPVWVEAKAMERWNQVFPEAMEQLTITKVEPKHQSKSSHSIRAEKDWEAVFEKLKEAQTKYEADDGRGGWWRRKRRSAADKMPLVSDVVDNVSRAVPDSVFSTPVFGVVQILLDSVKRGAEVRGQVIESLDGLVPIFSDVELLLATFEEDKNIRKAAVELAFATLVGIERAIEYFVSKGVVRSGKALFQGDFYGSELVESLQQIDAKARRLMEEATKSYQFEGRIFSHETIKIVQECRQDQKKMASVVNEVKDLLDGHIQERDQMLYFANERVKRLQVENILLLAQNNLLRSASPGARSSWSSCASRQHSPQPALEWHVTQEMLRQILDSGDVGLADEAFAMSKTADFPAKERSRAEQIVNHPLFRSWMTSPISAKLLVHWDRKLPRQVANISPLSLFCVSMARMLRGHPRFIPLLWLCGRHVDPAEGPVGGSVMLSSLISQLLQQHDFDTRGISSDGGIDIDRLRARNEEDLLSLLCFLIPQIPDAFTLVILIDNVLLYEREELKAKAVLFDLVRLVANNGFSAAIKILFTSTPGTDEIRWVFEDEGLILNVDALPQLVWSPSEERVARELGEALLE